MSSFPLYLSCVVLVSVEAFLVLGVCVSMGSALDHGGPRLYQCCYSLLIAVFGGGLSLWCVSLVTHE